MKLWLLGKKWAGGYDEFQGFVIRAVTPEVAMALAAKKARDERWLNPDRVVCHRLEEDGPEEIILEDFLSG